MNKKNISFLKIFQICSIIVIIICIFIGIKWFIDNRSSKQSQKIQVENLEFIDEPGVINKNMDFTNLLKTNPDTVAWLKVNNTNIDYSVVKAKDNSFYLKHSFDKSYNTAGWIFADYRNKFDGTDKNTIIYGHSRTDGTMFYTLRNALKKDWYNNQENHIIKLYTPKKLLLYKVFSVYEIAVNEVDNKTSFSVNSEYESYLNNIKNRSKFTFDTEVTSNDSILTLTTCSSGNFFRIMLHAKLIN